MDGRPNALNGLRAEVREFMRSCETLLSGADKDALTQDETDIVRYYIQSLTELCGIQPHSDTPSLAPRLLG